MVEHTREEIMEQLSYEKDRLADYDFRLVTTIWNDGDLAKLRRQRDEAACAVRHHERALRRLGA